MTKTKKWDIINCERNDPINQFSKTKINSNSTTFKSFLGKNLQLLLLLLLFVYKNPSYALLAKIHIYILLL